MKKVSVVFSLLLLASLVLAACGGGNSGADGTPGAFETPGVSTMPVTGTTPTTGVGAVSSPTVAATEPALATATTGAGAAVGTSTPAAGAGTTTGTPVAAADLSTSPDRLSALLDYEVRNSSGEVIGEVNGVLVNRNKVVSEEVTDDSTGNDTGSTTATGTPAAGAGTTTNTPAAGSAGTGTGTPAAGTSDAVGGAQIQYFVVELNMAFGETQGTGSTGGTGAGTATGTPAAGSSTTGTATPAAGATSAAPATTQTTTGLAGDDDGMLGAGDEVLLPFAAFEPMMVGNTTASDSDAPALVLTVDDQVLAGAPVFDRDSIDFMAATWDEEFQAYWSGQGLSIPVTGDAEDAAASLETVLLDDNFEGINVVNTNEDDLGEVEDFLLDTESGQFRYAILATGGFLGLGEKLIPVPMQMVYWVVDDDAVTDPAEREVDDVGEILINVPEDSFENAPSFDDLNEIDTTTADWDADITTYWQTFENQ